MLNINLTFLKERLFSIYEKSIIKTDIKINLNKLKEQFEMILEKNLIDFIIENIISKIIVKKNEDDKQTNLLIFINIFHNYKIKDVQKSYSFKRGYSTTCTKRYAVKYYVEYIF